MALYPAFDLRVGMKMTSLWTALTKSVKYLPDMKYAIGAVGLFAAALIVVGWVSGNWIETVGAVIVLLVSMFVLKAFSGVKTGELRWPAMAFAWGSVLLVFGAGVALLCYFAWPLFEKAVHRSTATTAEREPASRDTQKPALIMCSHLEGQVVDAFRENRPIPGSVVRVLDAETTERERRTDAQGTYRFSFLAPKAEYIRLSVEAPGFTSRVAEEWRFPPNCVIDLDLKPIHRR